MDENDVELHLDVQEDGAVKKSYVWYDEDGVEHTTNFNPKSEDMKYYEERFRSFDQLCDDVQDPIDVTDFVDTITISIYIRMIESILNTFNATSPVQGQVIRMIFMSLHGFIRAQQPRSVSKTDQTVHQTVELFYWTQDHLTFWSTLKDVLCERYGSMERCPPVLRDIADEIFEIEKEIGFWSDKESEEEV